MAQSEKFLSIEYDPKADAVYFTVSHNQIERTEFIGSEHDLRIADYDAEGNVVGVEILGPSYGARVSDLPYAEQIERWMKEHDFPIVP